MSGCIKRSISLFEVLLCVSLLSVALGYIGFQIHKTLKQEQFNKSAMLFLDKIYLARELSAKLGEDFSVIISATKTGIYYEISSTTSIANGNSKVLYGRKLLKGVDSFSFQKLMGADKERKLFRIFITNGGKIDPHGILTMKNKEKSARILLSYAPKIEQG